MPIGLSSATLAQNALLCACTSSRNPRQSFFQQVSGITSFSILQMSKRMKFIDCQFEKVLAIKVNCPNMKAMQNKITF